MLEKKLKGRWKNMNVLLFYPQHKSNAIQFLQSLCMISNSPACINTALKFAYILFRDQAIICIEKNIEEKMQNIYLRIHWPTETRL